jgi:hypothetical protein
MNITKTATRVSTIASILSITLPFTSRETRHNPFTFIPKDARLVSTLCAGRQSKACYVRFEEHRLGRT